MGKAIMIDTGCVLDAELPAFLFLILVCYPPSYSAPQVQIDQVADHVIRTLSPLTKRGVVLEKALATEKLPPIVADERRIIQLLSNLIGNALKFTEKVTALRY